MSIVKTKEYLEHVSLYYLGFNHGMEEGIRIVKEEHGIES